MGNEIITPHRVTGDRVHRSLFLICRHNTQVLDVWASTFAFEVPWNRRLFLLFLQIIVAVVTGFTERYA